MSERRKMQALEWLRLLEAVPGYYRDVLDNHGGDLASAAHELAVARLEVGGCGTPVPTAGDVYSAALEIATRVPFLDIVPTRAALVSLCRAQGLEVIGG